MLGNFLKYKSSSNFLRENAITMIIILLKFPASEIFVPDKAEADEGKTTPFRGRASTIGNGQIPRYV